MQSYSTSAQTGVKEKEIWKKSTGRLPDSSKSWREEDRSTRSHTAVTESREPGDTTWMKEESYVPRMALQPMITAGAPTSGTVPNVSPAAA